MCAPGMLPPPDPRAALHAFRALELEPTMAPPALDGIHAVVGDTADAAAPAGWTSTDHMTAETGWIDEAKVKAYAFPPSEDTLVFVCGVPGLYELLCGPRGDKEVKEEGFLEYINIFLNTGELPNLFPRDELDAIMGECREKYQAMYKGTEPTADEIWAFFIERVRSNLHLSLCFSPVGEKFRERARQFPGLVNECTIDWFLPWPQSLRSGQ